MTNADPHAPRTVVPIEPALLIAEAFDQAQVTEIRHSVTSCAHASGLGGQRLDDFVLAVNELITNAVRHGGGRGLAAALATSRACWSARSPTTGTGSARSGWATAAGRPRTPPAAGASGWPAS